jgi:hypothetical protein
MFTEINDRLMQTKERLRSKRKLEAMLSHAQLALREEQDKSSKVKDRLVSEKADVDKLEGLSLTGLFYSVLGIKREYLDKEREEYLAAKLKYDESVEAVEDSRKEVQRLRDELAAFEDVDQEYESLIGEKERLLAESRDSLGGRLLALSEQLADLTADRKELREAVQAGEAAKRALERVQSELSSAANWGTWDMLGGGMLSTMAKHSKIDSAKRHAHQAQSQLRRFQQQLADADQRLQVSLEIGGFSKFADYFFDGLIADWVVQSKIREASSACSSTVSKVSSAVAECHRRLLETEREIEQVNNQRREFIEEA